MEEGDSGKGWCRSGGGGCCFGNSVGSAGENRVVRDIARDRGRARAVRENAGKCGKIRREEEECGELRKDEEWGITPECGEVSRETRH